MVSRRLMSMMGVTLVCAMVGGGVGTAVGAPASGPDRAAAVTLVDGGVIDLSPRARAQSASAPLTTVPLNNRVTTSDGSQIAASDVLSFSWSSDTVSVLLYSEARPGEGRITPYFDGPGAPRAERPFGSGPTGGFVLPGSDAPVASGTYRYQIVGSLDTEAAEVVLVSRHGPQPTSGTLDLNLFVLDGSGLDTDVLNQGLNIFNQIFGQARIRIGNATLYHLTGADDFLSVPLDLSVGSPLRQLTANSRLASNPNAYNLFFVREITGDDGGVALGVSLGIPCALGIPGTISSGSVINVSGHGRSGTFDVADFGQTLAHETAHSLGLWHTSERDGSDHDTISDTPECTGAEPLEADACPDGDNFLFWSGLGTKLSAGQAYVLLRSPIVR